MRWSVHLVAQRGHEAVVVQLLLEKGTNVESTDSFGATAVYVGTRWWCGYCWGEGSDVEVQDECYEAFIRC